MVKKIFSHFEQELGRIHGVEIAVTHSHHEARGEEKNESDKQGNQETGFVSEHGDVSLFWKQKPRDQLEEGGLARSGSTGQEDEFSRFDLEIEIADEGAIIRDLASTNGTDVEGCRIQTAYLHPGARIGAGEVVLTSK